jgi:LmbE family N-acetylglucosaminyl deacetylase
MEIKLKQDILIVVAHKDDETIGMGGTIAKHTNNGDNVFCVAMTDGVSSRKDSTQSDVKKRALAANKAAKILNFKWLENRVFPDNSIDSIPLLSIIEVIEEAKNEINPKIIYTHSKADLNIDHRIVCDAVLTAFRPQPSESWNEIITFEVPSATDYGHPNVTGNFSPNLFVNIEKTWDLKKKALNCYSEEMRKYPHSRSLKALENNNKSLGNKVGLEFAEAFQIIRKIER